MSKIIVDRSRDRSRSRTPNDTSTWTAIPLDELPHRERMRRSRCPSDHLAPLRRFLLSSVGRPWDHVYRELSQHNDPRSTTQLHVLQHVRYFVAQRAKIIDGQLVCEHDSCGIFAPRYPLYVDPQTGILRKTPAPAVSKRKRKRVRRFQKIAPDRYVGEVKGQWCELITKPLTSNPAGCFDVALNRLFRHDTRHLEKIVRRTYDKLVYTVSMRPLSAKEMRKLALRPPAAPLPNIVR